MLAKIKNSKGLMLVLTPHLLWIGVLFVLPHIKLFGLSFVDKRSGEITLGNYAKFFESELYRDVFVHTALFAIMVTLITLAIAFPTAFIITKILGKKFFDIRFT